MELGCKFLCCSRFVALGALRSAESAQWNAIIGVLNAVDPNNDAGLSVDKAMKIGDHLDCSV